MKTLPSKRQLTELQEIQNLYNKRSNDYYKELLLLLILIFITIGLFVIIKLEIFKNYL